MGVSYNINKFNLLNTLKFPKRSSNNDYKIYTCNEREWIVVGESNVFHSYKNSTETNPNYKFGLLYVDTEDINEYYKEHPIKKLI